MHVIIADKALVATGGGGCHHTHVMSAYRQRLRRGAASPESKQINKHGKSSKSKSGINTIMSRTGILQRKIAANNNKDDDVIINTISPFIAKQPSVTGHGRRKRCAEKRDQVVNYMR